MMNAMNFVNVNITFLHILFLSFCSLFYSEIYRLLGFKFMYVLMLNIESKLDHVHSVKKKAKSKILKGFFIINKFFIEEKHARKLKRR